MVSGIIGECCRYIQKLRILRSATARSGMAGVKSRIHRYVMRCTKILTVANNNRVTVVQLYLHKAHVLYVLEKEDIEYI